MKRMFLAALLLGLLGIGCMQNQVLPPDRPASTKVPPQTGPQPVTPDQVTPANALESTRRLEEELNAAAPPQSSPTTPALRSASQDKK